MCFYLGVPLVENGDFCYVRVLESLSFIKIPHTEGVAQRWSMCLADHRPCVPSLPLPQEKLGQEEETFPTND